METTSRSPRPYEIIEGGKGHVGRVLKNLVETAFNGTAQEFTAFFPSDHQHREELIQSSIMTGSLSPIDSSHMSEYFEKVLHPSKPVLIGPIEAEGQKAQAEIKFVSPRVDQELFGYVQIELSPENKIVKLQLVPDDKGKDLLKTA